MTDDKQPRQTFLVRALAAIALVARTKRIFYADDIWPLLGKDHEVSLRNLGAAFKQARASGLCVPTGRFSRERVPKTQWRSLIKERRT